MKQSYERMWYLHWNYAVLRDNDYHSKGWLVPRLRGVKKWDKENATLALYGMIEGNSEGRFRITEEGLQALRDHRVKS